ncbi:hypothetical protein [Halocatena salina]|uniref:Uncharacterized protein n=1 Tax=Halocatena salina TaxID=2934340 RepID=A0A8U0A403_9EURY|nr:hypothetical protein [Halocatena salina]UPM43812.1 hypothetical protein MW046_05040 [Halocatena salina]
MEKDGDGDPYLEEFVSVDAHETVMRPLVQNRDGYGGIPQGDERRFISPQSVHSFPTEGMDSWSGTIPPAPAPDSDHMAGEMIDLYWMSALRDRPFDTYDGDITNEDIAADLTAIVEADLETIDYGPNLSQFLIQDGMFGAFPVSPKIKTFHRGQDYGTTRDEWLGLIAGRGKGAEASPPESRLTVGPNTWSVLIVNVLGSDQAPWWATFAVQHNLKHGHGYDIAVDDLVGPETWQALVDRL